MHRSIKGFIVLFHCWEYVYERREWGGSGSRQRQGASDCSTMWLFSMRARRAPTWPGSSPATCIIKQANSSGRSVPKAAGAGLPSPNLAMAVCCERVPPAFRCARHSRKSRRRRIRIRTAAPRQARGGVRRVAYARSKASSVQPRRPSHRSRKTSSLYTLSLA